MLCTSELLFPLNEKKVKQNKANKTHARKPNCPPSLFQVNVERRLFSFRFGDPQARMNWVHVDNLVLAHTLAAGALTLKGSCVAVSDSVHSRMNTTYSSDHSTLEIQKPTQTETKLGIYSNISVLQSGQAYFINDGVSVNLFEWLTPLVSYVTKQVINSVYLQKTHQNHQFTASINIYCHCWKDTLLHQMCIKPLLNIVPIKSTSGAIFSNW